MLSYFRPIFKNKLITPLSLQVNHIKEGGWSVLARKIVILLLFIPALPIVLIIRLLRPWVVIRFKEIFSGRIGHFLANTEVYLSEIEAGINAPPRRFIDIWYYNSPVCNVQVKRMWDRQLLVWPALIAVPIDRLNRLVPGGGAHTIPWRVNQDRDIYSVLESVSPHLFFSMEEEQQGQEKLGTMSVAVGAPFVCFHARDSAYMQATYPNFDASYHNYRDSNIHNYVLAAEELTRRGYYTMRMGAVVQEALHVSHPQIIDYAAGNHRTDFMDIYLGAKCHFFISSGTGIDAVPMIFRRPIVLVNQVPLEYVPSWFPYSLVIFKKHWLYREERFMTFREIIESGVGRFVLTEQYQEYGIELIENTPEEIAALVVEMDERLKRTWPTTEEDEVLQRRFWSIFPRSELHGKIVTRVGTEFLRQYGNWLD